MDTQSSDTGHEKTAEAAKAAKDPRMMSVQLFKPGVRVTYNNQSCTVHHITLTRGKIMVKLHELQEEVDSIKLELAPTKMYMYRQ
jgi:hypothetical protein